MSDIVSNALSEVFLFFQRLTNLFLAIICDSFVTERFTPSLDYFASLFVSSALRDSATMSSLDVLLKVFEKAGYTIMIVLIVYSAGVHFFGHIIEVKDSMIGIFKRCIFVIAMIYCIGNLGGHIANIGEEVEANLMSEILTALGGDAEIFQSYTSFITEGITSVEIIEDNDGNITVEEENIATVALIAVDALVLGPLLFVIKGVIQTILYGIVAYNFTKLCVELVKRYITHGIMYILLPSAAGFLTTVEGAQVFLTYFKMYGTQIGILIVTKTWIALSLFLMGNVPADIIGCFILITFINFGVRLEGFARDMGLSVTSQGSALLDSIATTGLIMAHAITGAGHAVGNGAIAIGSGTGKVGAVKFGSAITGRPTDPESIARTMNSHPAHDIRTKLGTGITQSEADLMKKLAANSLSSNKALQNAISETHDPIGACQGIVDAHAKNLGQILGGKDGMSLKANGAYASGQNGGIGVSLMHNGQEVMSGFLSDTKGGPNSIAFTDENGSQRYLNLSDEPLLDFSNPEGGIPLGGKEEVYDGSRTSGEMMTATDFDFNACKVEDVREDENGVMTDFGNDRSNYMIYGSENDARLVYKPPGRDAQLCGYYGNGMSFGKPMYQSDISTDYASGKTDKLFEQFSSSGIFAKTGFTPTSVESYSNGTYTLKGTSPSGAEMRICIEPALNNISACTRKNVSGGWRIFVPKGEKKQKTNS